MEEGKDEDSLLGDVNALYFGGYVRGREGISIAWRETRVNFVRCRSRILCLESWQRSENIRSCNQNT